MRQAAYMVLHIACCAALFWSVFCRTVMINESVRLDVRFAFYLVGCAALLGIIAPLAWGFVPTGYTLMLVTSVAYLQITTSKHWRGGVPPDFVKPTKGAS